MAQFPDQQGHAARDGMVEPDPHQALEHHERYEPLCRVDRAEDRTIELAGDGTDTVIGTDGHALQAQVENLILVGQSRNGAGNDLPNAIRGNDAENRLTGRGGNDQLLGGAGANQLIGGAGQDRLCGGTRAGHPMGRAGRRPVHIRRSAEVGLGLRADIIPDFSRPKATGSTAQASARNTGVPGNGVFVLSSSGLFSGTGGELVSRQVYSWAPRR
jgi:Ca2+-binding RTX toxin-like protein